jgi:hypothetical protein
LKATQLASPTQTELLFKYIFELQVEQVFEVLKILQLNEVLPIRHKVLVEFGAKVESHS